MPQASTPKGKQEFDVFLCHNSKDKPEVKRIAEPLKAQGIVPWLDEWELRPGLPWQRALEEQIEHIKTAAVFVGSNGRSPWQDMELEAFIREFVSRGCPVIPVVLADAPDKPQLPAFLRGMVQLLEMVDNSNNLRKSPLDWFFRQWAVRTDISPWSEAPSDFFCWHIHQLLRDMTRQPHLASVALKRKPLAMGMKAPRAPSIVDGFCQLPSQESVDGSVAPIVCPLVLAAARASRAAIGEDAQNDRRLATIPGELPGVETAALWPRYGEPARLFHVGRSVEPAQ